MFFLVLYSHSVAVLELTSFAKRVSVPQSESDKKELCSFSDFLSDLC